MVGKIEAAIPTSPGTYILCARLNADAELEVGALGRQGFPAGYYLYVGSALAGLRNRLGRHLRPEKRIRWHIDYLLAAASLERILCCVANERLECRWAEKLLDCGRWTAAAARFGASDCRCYTHLFWGVAPPDPKELWQILLCPTGCSRVIDFGRDRGE